MFNFTQNSIYKRNKFPFLTNRKKVKQSRNQAIFSTLVLHNSRNRWQQLFICGLLVSSEDWCGSAFTCDLGIVCCYQHTVCHIHLWPLIVIRTFVLSFRSTDIQGRLPIFLSFWLEALQCSYFLAFSSKQLKLRWYFLRKLAIKVVYYFLNFFGRFKTLRFHMICSYMKSAKIVASMISARIQILNITV